MAPGNWKPQGLISGLYSFAAGRWAWGRAFLAPGWGEGGGWPCYSPWGGVGFPGVGGPAGAARASLAGGGQSGGTGAAGVGRGRVEEGPAVVDRSPGPASVGIAAEGGAGGGSGVMMGTRFRAGYLACFGARPCCCRCWV